MNDRKEYIKEWRQKNKERCKEYIKKCNLKNKDKRKQYNTNWARMNRNKINAADRKRYKENPEKRKRYSKHKMLKKLYGITIDQYEEMYNKQNGLCFLCNSSQVESKNNRNLCVDHNHFTNKIRKLLCNKCNIALGLFNEDIPLMERAIQYLKDHN